MKKISLLILLIIPIICNGQITLGKYYQFSDTLRNRIAKDTSKRYKERPQEAAYLFSYINDYRNVLRIADINAKPTGTSVYDEDYVLNYKTLNAKQYILERAKKEKIIILNEAHHQPIHRVFTESLLQDLYNEGYRYLGMEAVSRYDKDLNKRKYPQLFTTGLYVDQPQCGNLVRTALQIGYYVFGYDTMSKNMQGKEREIFEAKNIKTILDKDPKAKMIIHCGYGHLVETEMPRIEKAMAGRLKEYTGIDPFTIDQVELTEKSKPEFENTFYKAYNLDYYAVFVDSSGNLFNGINNNNSFDCCVYHPRTIWKDGRPKWVFENGRNAVYVNDEIRLNFPCLVFAYYMNKVNYEFSIPTDIIELKNKTDKIALSLTKGNFLIVVKDSLGNKQKFWLFRTIILDRIMR